MSVRAATFASIAVLIVMIAAPPVNQHSPKIAIEVASIRVNRSGDERIIYQFAPGGRFIALTFRCAAGFSIWSR